MTTNCQQIEQEFDALLDKTLPFPQAEIVQAHVSQCSVCREMLEKERDLRQRLANQPVLQMRSDFAKQAFETAKAQNENPGNHSIKVTTAEHREPGYKKFTVGLAAAFAMGAIAWVGAIHFYPVLQPVDPIHTVSLTIGEVKKVHLVFNSPEVMENVTVAIILPDNTEFSGRAGVTNLEWKTSLRKGKNIISLPIVAQQEKNGEIITRISSGNKDKVFKVRLSVEPQRKVTLNKALFNYDVQPKGVSA